MITFSEYVYSYFIRAFSSFYSVRLTPSWSGEPVAVQHQGCNATPHFPAIPYQMSKIVRAAKAGQGYCYAIVAAKGESV